PPGTDMNTRNAPDASTRVIDPFARIWPTSKFTLEMTGRDWSAGHAERYPAAWGRSTVNVSARDVAFAGMPHTPRSEICTVRASRRVYPLPRRVSAKRHGCSDT